MNLTILTFYPQSENGIKNRRITIMENYFTTFTLIWTTSYIRALTQAKSSCQNEKEIFAAVVDYIDSLLAIFIDVVKTAAVFFASLLGAWLFLVWVHGCRKQFVSMWRLSNISSSSHFELCSDLRSNGALQLMTTADGCTDERTIMIFLIFHLARTWLVAGTHKNWCRQSTRHVDRPVIACLCVVADSTTILNVYRV